MATIEIRDVPDDLYELLCASAKDQGQTLQQYLLELLTDIAARAVRDADGREPGRGER
ncbi:hypothetical protein [Glycomyces albidus]|uniref:hypothetical protein n=1 Tax=Glycomyces albidus TaxID=2656774 RepID=UPI0012904EB6|nr:hypothetical protein [Glycomyces albidus]